MKKQQRKDRAERMNAKAKRRLNEALENKESAVMRRVDRDWSAWSSEDRPQVGDFTIYDSECSKSDPYRTPKAPEDRVVVKMIIMMLPGGHICQIPIRPVPAFDKPLNGGHSWEWDGNMDKPTLKPSVHSIGRWHGHIKQGRMESCK